MRIERPINIIMSYYTYGHDVNITLYNNNNGKFFVLPLAIFAGEKHLFIKYYTLFEQKLFFRRVENYLRQVLKIDHIDLLISTDRKHQVLDVFMSLDMFKNTIVEIHPMKHHESHMWCGYGQSNFDSCVAFTHDGIGDDESFNFYEIDRGRIVNTSNHQITNGLAYQCLSGIAVNLWNSRKDFYAIEYYRAILSNKRVRERTPWVPSFSDETLDYAGKGMGMAGFEEPAPELRQKIASLYRDVCREGYDDYNFAEIVLAIEEIKPGIFYAEQDEQRKFAKQMMWAVQKELQNITLSYIDTMKKRIQDRGNNLVLSGGVAMNVLLNQKIKERYPHFNIYVPPNPDDSGLSLGIMLSFLSKTGIEYDRNFLYAGSPIIYDIDPTIVKRRSRVTDVQEISQLLSEGKILAIFKGRHEIGARALGNRSILADPKFSDMKDTINKKVKFREEYRPFAPLCRKDDAPIYFDSPDYENMEAMSFCPKVREEYRSVFPSIVHVDGTSRLQTVTEEQSPFLYELLSIHPTDVLLNTSFNVAGKPICNKLSEAISILDNTGLDYLVWEFDRKLFITS